MREGSRVIYKPITMRRGQPQAHRPATILAIYPSENQIRIKCDGERIHRRVRISHVEVINKIGDTNDAHND